MPTSAIAAQDALEYGRELLWHAQHLVARGCTLPVHAPEQVAQAARHAQAMTKMATTVPDVLEPMGEFQLLARCAPLGSISSTALDPAMALAKLAHATVKMAITAAGALQPAMELASNAKHAALGHTLLGALEQILEVVQHAHASTQVAVIIPAALARILEPAKHANFAARTNTLRGVLEPTLGNVCLARTCLDTTFQLNALELVQGLW